MNGDLTDYIHSMRLMLHDLAQPLSVMVGTVDLMMIESAPGTREFDEIRNISNQLQVVLDKINDLRRLTRKVNYSATNPENS